MLKSIKCFMAVCLAAALLTGCSSSGSTAAQPAADNQTAAPSASAEADSQAATPSASAAAEQPADSSASETAGAQTDLPFVTLKYYNIGDKAKGMDMVLAEVNKVLKERLNCEFTQEYIPWEDFENKYQLVFASGEEFDGIYTASWSSYAAVAAKNGFLELTPEMIQKYAPFVWEAVPQDGWNQVKVQGKIYMLPHTTREFNHYVVGVRGDLREKYNLAPIKTYDDLDSYLAAIKANEPDLLPISLGQTGEISNWMVLWNLMHDRFNAGELFVQLFYVKNDDSNAKILSFFDQPDCADFLAMMNKWQKAGYWTRSALSSTERTVDDFKNGLVAACYGNMGTVEGCYSNDMTNNNGAWKVELYDLTAAANKPVPTYPYNAGGIAFNRNAKNWERLMMMVNMFREEKPLYMLISNGIEGVHWKYNDDGKTYEYLDVPPDEAYGDAITWGPFRNVNFAQPYTSKNSPYYINLFENAKTREKTIPASAFLFNNTNVKNEIAAISDVYQQYVLPLILGFSDPSELDNVRDKLKTAGLDKVIAEMQSQMDANLASLK